MYGANYTESAFVLSLLSIYYGYLSTGSPVGSLQAALGRTDTGFYWTIVRIVLNTLAILIGSYFKNIEGIILSLFLITLLSKPISWRITIRPLINGHFIEYMMKSIKPLLVISVFSVPFYLLLGKVSSIMLIIGYSMVYLLIYSFIISKLFPNSYCVNLLKVFVKKYV